MNHALVRLSLRSVTASFFLLAAVMLLVHYRAPMQWAAVYGTVDEVAVVPADGDEGSAPGSRFVPAVVYTYEVGGRMYEARELAPHRWIYWSRDAVRATLEDAGIHSGARMPVFYNPEEPAEAVLIREVPWRRWEVILLVLFLVVLPLGVVAYSVRDFFRGGESRRGDVSRGRFW